MNLSNNIAYNEVIYTKMMLDPMVDLLSAGGQSILVNTKDRSVAYATDKNDHTKTYKVGLGRAIPDVNHFYDDIELALYILDINEKIQLSFQWDSSDKTESYHDYLASHTNNRTYAHNLLLKQLLFKKMFYGDLNTTHYCSKINCVITELVNKILLTYDNLLQTEFQRVNMINYIIKEYGYDTDTDVTQHMYLFLYYCDRTLRLRRNYPIVKNPR
jgi:hypothetical protein